MRGLKTPHCLCAYFQRTGQGLLDPLFYSISDCADHSCAVAGLCAFFCDHAESSCTGVRQKWIQTQCLLLTSCVILDKSLHLSESHGPAELATKYANFSEGACKPGYASALMTAIFPRFSKPAPMFLDDSFRKWARIREFVPPFGIKGQDNLIKAILSVTKEYRLTPALDSLRCRRCIIVGNGGVLANKSLGSRIDDYDIVVRLNSAPVKGFEKDVGSKTTLRITYPEGAMQRPEQYERDSLFVLAGFKWQDFKWLKYIVYKERVSASDGFWKSVATRVPKEPPEIRILNPYFIQEAAFTLIGLPFNNGLMGRGNIPTLGSVAVTMALHGCDEVAVAGFGYDMSTPNAPLHYYETVRMSAIKESWTHNIQREKEFLRKLVKARVITDLSSGI
ncbi:CMP-N-acetylneuraminate-beta-1,4-galactoside alpha-2,3-sialyltransferase isoform X1 [Cynocephalus volans]